MRRGRLLILTLCSVIAVGAAAATWHRVVAGSGPATPRPVLRGTEVWAPGMRPALPFALRDQNGRVISRAALRGHVYIVTFLESHCRQACPVAGRDLAVAQQELGPHAPLTIVIISVAPGQDTPASVRHFAHEVGLRGDWHWLMGSRAQLAPVWQSWGTYVQPTPHEIIHTAAAYLVDQNGSVRVADMIPFRPHDLAGSVKALLNRPLTSMH